MQSRPLIGSDKLWLSFFYFVVPLVATNILQNLSGTINTIYVGQMLGVNAIAAVSVFFPILFCLLAFIIGLSAGSTVLIGQAWGAKQTDTVRAVVGATLFLTFWLSLVIAFLGVYFTDRLLRLLGTDPSVLPLSRAYVQWMLAGSPLLFAYLIYTSILRGVGDSTTPLIALGLSCLIGLVVTPGLIMGYAGLPRLGIVGPALATLIGYAAVLLFLVFYLRYKQHPLQFNRQMWQAIRWQPQLAKQILRLGVPTGVQMMTNAMAGLVIIGLVNRYGAHATAAYGAVNQVLNYIQFPALSVAIAASIFAAQAIGAERSDILHKVTRTALIIGFVMTGSLVLIAYIASKPLMALFITAPDVLLLAQKLLFIVLWSVLFFGASAIFAAIMRASGTVMVPMFINIIAILGIEIPCAIWFGQIWGLEGIWYAYALAFVCLALMQWAYYHWVWQKKTITRLI